MTSTSPLVRIHTSTSSAWRKQVSRRVPVRVPRARRSACSSLASWRTSSRGTSSMARYAIHVGSSAGWTCGENSLPRTPRPGPQPQVTRVSRPHPADLVEITSCEHERGKRGGKPWRPRGLRCCTRDGGCLALRSRLAEEGFKPPRGALAEDRRLERRGKRRGRTTSGMDREDER